MNASQISPVHWPKEFKPTDWPTGTLPHMDAGLFVMALFPIRKLSGCPMWPSSLVEGHVRNIGKSRHSTEGMTRLSDATDMHIKTIENMLTVMECAEQIPCVGGIGIYFDTNTPMIHLDMRPNRLVWLCRSIPDGKGGWERQYVYKCNDIIEFYKVLADELENFE